MGSHGLVEGDCCILCTNTYGISRSSVSRSVCSCSRPSPYSTSRYLYGSPSTCLQSSQGLGLWPSPWERCSPAAPGTPDVVRDNRGRSRVEIPHVGISLTHEPTLSEKQRWSKATSATFSPWPKRPRRFRQSPGRVRLQVRAKQAAQNPAIAYPRCETPCLQQQIRNDQVGFVERDVQGGVPPQPGRDFGP
jgi:hypothetical protein